MILIVREVKTVGDEVTYMEGTLEVVYGQTSIKFKIHGRRGAEGATFVDGDMVGLAGFDLVLGIVGGGVMGVSLVVEIFGVDLCDRAGSFREDSERKLEKVGRYRC